MAALLLFWPLTGFDAFGRSASPPHPNIAIPHPARQGIGNAVVSLNVSSEKLVFTSITDG